MRGSEFAELTAFLEVAERGSFARAAAQLGVTASALSQSVRQLEERLGVRLLNRTTRSVSTTEAGERLQADLRPAVDALGRATEAVSALGGRPSGRLRLTASRVATELLLAPRLGAFRRRFPGIALELSVEDRAIDIVRQRFDAGIRRGELLEQDMVCRRISPDERFLAVAAPDYLAVRGRPGHPRDLQRHDCIAIRRRSSEAIPPWRFEREGRRLEVRPAPALVVDDARLALQAAAEGIGIAYLAESFLAAELAAGRLSPLLEDWAPRRAGFFLYYPSRRQNPPALRALADFLCSPGGA